MIGIKLITFTCDWTEEDRGRTRIEDVKKKHATREVTFPTGEKGSTRLTSFQASASLPSVKRFPQMFMFLLELKAYEVLNKPEQVSRP